MLVLSLPLLCLLLSTADAIAVSVAGAVNVAVGDGVVAVCIVDACAAAVFVVFGGDCEGTCCRCCLQSQSH